MIERNEPDFKLFVLVFTYMHPVCEYIPRELSILRNYILCENRDCLCDLYM